MPFPYTVPYGEAKKKIQTQEHLEIIFPYKVPCENALEPLGILPFRKP